MTKAYSVGAKRRAKRGVVRMVDEWEREVDIATVERDDPLATVREARKRMSGETDDKAVLDPIFGEDAGRAIEAEARDKAEANKLWKLFLDYDRADDIYFRRVIGRPRFPSVSKMEFMPERLETRPDDRPDLRTEDEKHRDAVNVWMRWQGHLGCMSAHERSAVVRASRQMDELSNGGRATVHGRSFVAALRVLHAVVEERAS